MTNNIIDITKKNRIQKMDDKRNIKYLSSPPQELFVW